MERGAPPIPEEYQKQAEPPSSTGLKKKTPAPPSLPPPENIDEAAHAAFDKAKIEAAKKKEVRQALFHGFLPRTPSKGAVANDNTNEPQISPKRQPPAPQPPINASKRAPPPPRPPSGLPPDNVNEEQHAAFQAAKIEAFNRRMLRPPSIQRFRTHLSLPSSAEGLSFDVNSAIHRFTPKPPDFPRDHQLREKRTSLIMEKRAIVFEETQPMTFTEKITYYFKKSVHWFAYETEHHHLMERLAMAGFSVAILWLTSLFAVDEYINTLLPNTLIALNNVTIQLECAAAEIQRQKVGYAECATDRAFQCSQYFDQDLSTEVQACNASIQYNQAIIDYITFQRGNCSNNFGQVISSIQYMSQTYKVNLFPEFAKYNFSVNSTCNQITTMFSNQVIAVQGHNTAVNFKSVADVGVNDSFSQYLAQAQYSSDYKVQSQGTIDSGISNLNSKVPSPSSYFSAMSSTQDQLYACSSATGTYNSVTCPTQSVGEQIDNMRSEVYQSYVSQLATTQTYMSNLQKAYQPLESFYLAFSSLAASVNGLLAALNGAANGVSGANGGGIGAFGYVQMDPSLGPTPSFAPASQFSSIIGTTDTLSALNDQIITEMGNTTSSIQKSMQANANAVLASQNSFQSTFFSDYDPPTYDVASANTSWQFTSSAYLVNIESNLNLVAKSTPPALTTQYEVTTNTTDEGTTAQALLQSPHTTQLSFYLDGSINIDDLNNIWNYVVYLTVVMDIAYRVVHSFSLVRTHAKVSSVVAPPADVRLDPSSKGNVKQNTITTPDQAIAKIITNPAFDLVFILVFVFVFAAALLALYEPMFNEFYENCYIVHTLPSNLNSTVYNGSMLARDYNAIGYEYASSEGDSITSSQIGQINIERELVCSKNDLLVYQQQKSLYDQYQQNVQQMQQVLTNVNSFRSCINTVKIDETYPTLASVATNGTAVSVNASLYAWSCDAPFPVLDTRQFECNNIEVCIPSCYGPEAAIVEDTSYQAGCLSEFYIHAVVISSALKLFSYILLNISRILLLRGMRRIFVSQFAMHKYNYIGTTTEDGELLFPDVQNKTWNEVIAAALKKAIKSFKFYGWILIVISIVINIPWIYLIVVLHYYLPFWTYIDFTICA